MSSFQRCSKKKVNDLKTPSKETLTHPVNQRKKNFTSVYSILTRCGLIFLSINPEYISPDLRAVSQNQCERSHLSSRSPRHMWLEFVFGSLLCSEKFFSGYRTAPKMIPKFLQRVFWNFLGWSRTALYFKQSEPSITSQIFYFDQYATGNGTYLKLAYGNPTK